ncbi:hypothetical protein BD769DRAFT_1386668 [Suillus cothurnatus]|nr:hypothetical protein BD769DRAFT_1386668 [Suillus cothurnatus]
MTTFGKSTFDTSIYVAFRPTCPRPLFDFIFRYHERNKGARWDRPVDLGCGTGQATVELTPFKYLMIEVAQGTLKKTPGAQSLPFLEDSSVDLVIAGAVLRKDGSAAFWIYSEFRFTRYPSLTQKIKTYSQGVDPLHSVGLYWQQPGRSILENHLVKVLDGNEVSSLHTLHQRNPTNAENPPRGDIAVQFWKDLKEGAEREDGRAVEGHDEVDIECSLALMMVKRA